MKSTSIFGGVQIFNILISIIRSKVVAVLLGPAGMGLMGLLISTVGIIASVTNFGLATSAVREISDANETHNNTKITETVAVFRKLARLTGALGMFVTIALSPLLSQLTFGNYDYTLAFIAIAVTLLMGQLSVGQTVLLQGMRKISWLAKANMYSSLFGLLVSLPLYWFFGQDGIVPAIILTSIAVFLIQYFYSEKIKIQSQTLSYKKALLKGRGMLKLGFMLSLGGLTSVAASYIIRIFIAHIGSVEQVGFYNAGFTMINTYVGMVFAAMATDYYPRLAGISKDVVKCNQLINEQSEIALFILAPLICIFLVFINWVVIILYSDKFLPVSEMIHWAILGVFFKTVSWSLSFLILAKGDSKAFFWNELVANIYILALNGMGYYYGGLTGLGISFLVGYFLHFIQIFLVCRLSYGYQPTNYFYKLFAIYLALGIVSFLVATQLESWQLYTVGTALIVFISLLSLYLLNKRMRLSSLFTAKFKK